MLRLCEREEVQLSAVETLGQRRAGWVEAIVVAPPTTAPFDAIRLRFAAAGASPERSPQRVMVGDLNEVVEGGVWLGADDAMDDAMDVDDAGAVGTPQMAISTAPASSAQPQPAHASMPSVPPPSVPPPPPMESNAPTALLAPPPPAPPLPAYAISRRVERERSRLL